MLIINTLKTKELKYKKVKTYYSDWNIKGDHKHNIVK